jgi:cytochrome c6
MKKIFLFSLVALFIISCANKQDNNSSAAPTPKEESSSIDEFDSMKKEEKEKSPIVDGINAGQLFKQSCAVCHGNDGKLGANGSKDLTMSILTIEEKVTMITNGKGLMTAFDGILTPEEIKAVAKYTEQLKS